MTNAFARGIAFACLLAAQARAQRSSAAGVRADEFSDVRCNSDVVRALIGRPSPNERVVAIEAAHRDIGLKNRGGMIMNDSLFLIGWEMCGREYELLTSLANGISTGADTVLDAILFPQHSRREPAFIGTCARNGTARVATVHAVLDNPAPRRPGEPVYMPDDTISLGAKAAWLIDERRRRFVRLDTTALRCPRGGIISADGGM